MTLPIRQLTDKQAKAFKSMVTLKLANLYPGRLQPVRAVTSDHEHIIDLDLNFFERGGVENTHAMLDTAFRIARAFGWSEQVLDAVLDETNVSVRQESDLGLIIEGPEARNIRAVENMSEEQATAFGRLCQIAAQDEALPKAAPLMLDLLSRTLLLPHSPDARRVLLESSLKLLTLCQERCDADIAGGKLERLARCMVDALAWLPAQDPLREAVAAARDTLLQLYCEERPLLPGLVLLLLKSHISEPSQPVDEETASEGPCDVMVRNTALTLFDQCAGQRTGKTAVEQLLHMVQSMPGKAAEELRAELNARTQEFSETAILSERSLGAQDRVLAELREAGLDLAFGWVNGVLTIQLNQQFDPSRHSALLLKLANVCLLDMAPMVVDFLLSQNELDERQRQAVLQLALKLASADPGEAALPLQRRIERIRSLIQCLRACAGVAIEAGLCSGLCDRLLELNDPSMVIQALELDLDDAMRSLLLTVGMKVVLTQPGGVNPMHAQRLAKLAGTTIASIVATATDGYLALLNAHLSQHGPGGKAPTLRGLCTPYTPPSGGSMHAACTLWSQLCEMQMAVQATTGPGQSRTESEYVSSETIQALKSADPLANDRKVLGAVIALLKLKDPDVDSLITMSSTFRANHPLPNGAPMQALLDEMQNLIDARDATGLRAILCCTMMFSVKWPSNVTRDPQVRCALGLLFDELAQCKRPRLAAHLLVRIQQFIGVEPVLWDSTGGEEAHASMASFLASALFDNRADFANEAETVVVLAMANCLAQLGDHHVLGPAWWPEFLRHGRHRNLLVCTAVAALNAQATSPDSPLNKVTAHTNWRSPHYLDPVSVWNKAGLNTVLVILGGLVTKEGDAGAWYLGLPSTSLPPDMDPEQTLLHTQAVEPGGDAVIIAHWPAAKPYLVVSHCLMARFESRSRNHPGRQLIERALQQLVTDLRRPSCDNGQAKPSDLMAMHEAIATSIQYDLDEWTGKLVTPL